MATTLLIVETHPVQYRSPIYSRLHELCPGQIHVVYGSDFSLRGGLDPGFSRPVAWDTDLLAGYPSTVLDETLRQAPNGWRGLKGRGLPALIRRHQPKAILLNSLNYLYDYTAYVSARLAGIPVWMRCETQDEAFPRSSFKTFLRSAYYRLLYTGIDKAFVIGALNRRHWLRHGLRPDQLLAAYYCTPDRAGGLNVLQREQKRQSLRMNLGIGADQCVVAFFGKLISKKDPNLLLQSLPFLSPSLREHLALLFVGSGDLQEDLEIQASHLQDRLGVPSFFPGFINQRALVDWYLAADVVVLPSRRAGETWGLVVNEALQAGCAVVVSEAVGCSADFGSLERFRTIPVGAADHLAQALMDLACIPRSFDWAQVPLKLYSIEAAAQSLAGAMAQLG
jgi:glycosyltransferase involved in cell wall biosynthesis